MLADQFGVKSGYRPINDLDGIEWQPPDGEAGAGERDNRGFILFRKREAETGHTVGFGEGV